MNIENTLTSISDFLWGTPLLVFLLTASTILLFYSKFVPLKGFIHSFKLIAGKVKFKSEGDGQISHFQALCNALAATIGLGNISGVAVAIYQGGSGAIFWMWISALFGMNTKFFECSLAVIYRGKNYLGEIDGGPMYVIENALSKKFKIMALAFAVCGLIGTLSLFQINQLAGFLEHEYNVPTMGSGIFFGIVVAYILLGGLKRISQVSSKIVPIMGVFYIVLCLLIIALNITMVPEMLKDIVLSAFNIQAGIGGVTGYALMHVIQTGVKRATFSNEAGIGTAPMAHSNVKTSEPISEGYVAMLGPFFDTICVCTMTALVILINMDGKNIELNGIQLTSRAFQQSLGNMGVHCLAIIIFLFSFSTMIGMANYNKKCWDYLFRGKWGLNNKIFILYYSFSIIVGASIKMTNVINLMDIAYALMALPNIIAAVILAKKVKIELKIYNQKYL